MQVADLFSFDAANPERQPRCERPLIVAEGCWSVVANRQSPLGRYTFERELARIAAPRLTTQRHVNHWV